MVTLIDYGVGNLGSILNMFKKIGVPVTTASDAAGIDRARKILLPGVGAFDAAIKRIDELGLRQALDRKALVDKIPILGVCLGMQLLTRSSEEGKLPGLAWIPADTRAFRGKLDSSWKIPHMGWNQVRQSRPSGLTRELPGDSRFYFVHSYYVKCDSTEDSILEASYGLEFTAALQRGNIFGAQFHPEKSHKFGMRLLKNFGEL